MLTEIKLEHKIQTTCIAKTDIGEYRDAAYGSIDTPIDEKALKVE